MSTLDLIGNADSSESEDEDYIPSAEDSDTSGCDAETESDDGERPVATTRRRKQLKGKKEEVTPRPGGKAGTLCDASEDAARDGTSNVACGMDDAKEDDVGALIAQEEKAKADLLWSDFTRDVDGVPKKRAAVPDSEEASTSGSASLVAAVPEKKVRITQLLEFAGEVVKVDNEVPADSNEARFLLEKQEEAGDAKPNALSRKKSGGVASVLSRLVTKKQKMNTLEKSKLDWDSYKRSEGIAEDLLNHNKGKDGYLERQAFLQRTDERQFEVEKGLRAKNRTTHRV
uniref:Craniofacial development protein 1 n=1 Tax=Rhipicephalus appendiculatus TaxID=34631 RepID=A0A131Z0Y7_RHIAP